MSFSAGILALALGAQPFDLREAARLDSLGKCAESEPHYQRALAAGNPSPALLNNAGNHYLACGQPEKARIFFTKVVETNPSHANANLQLARLSPPSEASAYLDRVNPGTDAAALFTLGTEYARVGRFDRAEERLQQAAAARPGDFDILFQLGRAAARAGHLDRARPALEAALKLRPEDIGALAEAGLAAAASKDAPRAVYLLAQANRKAPQHPGIALALARAAEDAGYYGDAALAYDGYLKLRPADEIARRDRARVLALTGARLKEGLAEMAAYIARHPTDPVGHFNLAQFTWRDKPDESLEQLAAALRLDPKFAPAHVARAWLLHRLGRTEEALPHLQSALEVVPDDVRALDLLGVALLSLDRAGEAEPPLRRALAKDPNDAKTLLHLGRALMALGKEDDARRMLERYQQARPSRQRDPRREPGMIESATLPDAARRAREIERFRTLSRARPDDPLLQLNLATLLLADGRNEEATEEYRQLLKTNSDANIWKQAGRALLDAGQRELARQFLHRAGPSLELAMATPSPAEAIQVLDQIPAAARSGDYYLLRAHLLDAAGQSGQAMAALNQGLAQAADPSAIQKAAVLLARAGREAEALKLVAGAIVKSPGDSGLQLAQAVLLALTGKTAEAARLFRSIEARWPEWDRVYAAHGLALRRAGNEEQAAAKLRVAESLSGAPPACDTLRQWFLETCGVR